MKLCMLQLLVASSLITSSAFSETNQESQLKNQQITISPEHKTGIEQRLNEFTKTHLALLQPEELQYLTNLIYFTYALASLDTHVRAKAQEILFCAKATQAALLNYTQETESREYLAKTINTIDAAVNAQIEHLKAWQHCCMVEDSLPKDSRLLQCIETFKDTIESEIGVWATEHKEAFNKQLDQCCKTFIDAGESLTMVGNTYRNLPQDPSLLPSVPANKHITKIGVASRAASKVDEQCWKAIEAALQITEAETALQEFSIAIVGMYYQAASSELAKYDARHRTFMYNAKGLIPAEQRTQELP